MSAGARRVPAGAHYGVRDWLAQRLTAIILGVYVLVLLAELAWGGRLDYEGWAALFAPAPMKVATELAFAALCYHAWIGIRDVWMDYVRPTAIRLVLHSLTILWLLYCMVWCAQILGSV
jgi:succinate dehydrogenase / fumarate reductase, membrane anchor subunit